MTVYMGRLDVQEGNMTEQARAFLHGFCDYYTAGEAWSFTTGVGPGTTDPTGEDDRPLSEGVPGPDAAAIIGYREGWSKAASYGPPA